VAARGLKTKIAFNVALLLLVSALLTDILVVMVVQSVMMRDRIARGRETIENIGKIFLNSGFSEEPHALTITDSVSQTALAVEQILLVHIVGASGDVRYTRSREAYPIEKLNMQIKKVRTSGKPIIEELGYQWALFWWHPSAICISIPIQDVGHLAGVASTVIPLTPIYMKLRQYNNPIFLYILINTGILTIVGLYRIFRIYLRPIDRIVHQADDFHEDGDLFFVFRHEDNELNRLSSALNRMLTRISSDKKKLQATVASLEQANVDLKRAQKEIIRAEKMASIGRLAAGIAHEIGNPIGIVLGYLDMLKQKSLEEEDKADFLQRTEDEVQRINTVIRQLLDVARPKNAQNEFISVHSAIEDIVGVMQLQPVMNDIAINLQLNAQHDSVWGNEDQLRQVFLNLLLNAADAIHGSASAINGRIDLLTTVVGENAKANKPKIQVRFEDNGAGMDQKQLQDIFDPFFTTKEPGKGTGLGLSVSYMIVEGMGGTISAESHPGEGATFIIELPIIVHGS
jgi:signal transduction histidine kinase